MIEETYELTQGNTKNINKMVMKQNGQYIHMTFPKGEGLPIHLSNAELFMTVLRGKLSLGLNNQETVIYNQQTMINIPYQTKMNVRNEDEETLELIVVKIIPEGKSKI
jgi:quercetin dioxygenase-like cupin family protein